MVDGGSCIVNDTHHSELMMQKKRSTELSKNTHTHTHSICIKPTLVCQANITNIFLVSFECEYFSKRIERDKLNVRMKINCIVLCLICLYKERTRNVHIHIQIYQTLPMGIITHKINYLR